MVYGLKLPKLPTIPRPLMPGQKRRRSTDRRKSGRITLEDLNRFGAEALKKRFAEVTKPPDRRPGYMKVLDILDVPRNTIANMLANISGVDKSKMERATGARGLRAILEDALLNVMYDLPSQPHVNRCIITKEVITKGAEPELETEDVEVLPTGSQDVEERPAASSTDEEEVPA